MIREFKLAPALLKNTSYILAGSRLYLVCLSGWEPDGGSIYRVHAYLPVADLCGPLHSLNSNGGYWGKKKNTLCGEICRSEKINVTIARRLAEVGIGPSAARQTRHVPHVR